jgi:hypothetical protein
MVIYSGDLIYGATTIFFWITGDISTHTVDIMSEVFGVTTFHELHELIEDNEKEQYQYE